jgi:hypothetical protein
MIAPLTFLGSKEARFRGEGAGKTKPRSLRCAVTIGYKNSGRNKANPVIFLVIYPLRQKLAGFSANLNANDQGFRPCILTMLPQSFDSGWRESSIGRTKKPERQSPKLSSCASPKTVKYPKG